MVGWIASDLAEVRVRELELGLFSPAGELSSLVIASGCHARCILKDSSRLRGSCTEAHVVGSLGLLNLICKLGFPYLLSPVFTVADDQDPSWPLLRTTR